MTLDELIQYGKEKYGLQALRPFKAQPNLIVMTKMDSSQWVAVLLKDFRDSSTGEVADWADIRCGRDGGKQLNGFYGFSKPHYMIGTAWIGMALDDHVSRKLAEQALNYALCYLEHPSRKTIILQPANEQKTTIVKTAEKSKQSVMFHTSDVRNTPRRILNMMQMYRPIGYQRYEREVNFIRQGLYMKDYTDQYDWQGDILTLNPTYHDLSIPQLRGYFTWRTKVRQGTFEKTNRAFTWLYVFELLNLITVKTPQEGWDRLEEFREKYLKRYADDTGFYETSQFEDWRFGFAVYYQLDREKILSAMLPFQVANDKRLAVLKNYERSSDEEIFQALMKNDAHNFKNDALFKKRGQEVVSLYSFCWRYLMEHFRLNGKSIFHVCFGDPHQILWSPFSSAIFIARKELHPFTIEIDEIVSSHYENGVWTLCYQAGGSRQVRLYDLLRMIDCYGRIQLKTGGRLKEVPLPQELCAALQEAVKQWDRKRLEEIEQKEKMEREAQRPKVDIDLSRLSSIRRDAEVTKEWLLSEEEKEEEKKADASPVRKVEQEEDVEDARSSLFTQEERTVLELLLSGKPAAEYLKSHHLLPSVLADSVNEKLFEQVGDSVLECDGQKIVLVEDYKGDVQSALKGELG